MRQASDVAADLQTQLHKPSTADGASAAANDESPLMLAIKEVFKEFRRMYGGRFTSRFVGDTHEAIAKDVLETRRVWARQLHGLTAEDLSRGLAALPGRPERDQGWPPSADEFRALCSPRHKEPYERQDFQGCALNRDRMLEQKPLSAAENAKRATGMWAALRGDYPRGEA